VIYPAADQMMKSPISVLALRDDDVEAGLLAEEDNKGPQPAAAETDSPEQADSGSPEVAVVDSEKHSFVPAVQWNAVSAIRSSTTSAVESEAEPEHYVE
jgi:hypothetical protein